MAAAFTPVSTTEEILKSEPWKQPWWHAGKRDIAILGWVLLIHITAAIGLVLYPIPGWRVFLGALALVFLGGLGTTVGYHRAIAHRSLKLNPWARGVLIFFAMFNGSGAPTTWAAGHRLHHAKADTPEDISSPRWGGFWWAHLRWLWQAGEPPIDRYCPDLERRIVSRVAMVPDADPHAFIFRRTIFQPGRIFLAGRDSFVLRTACAMLRQQRLPHRTGRHSGSGLEPQRNLARSDASVPGRELASQPSRAPRFRAARMELEAARRRLHADTGAREARPRH